MAKMLGTNRSGKLLSRAFIVAAICLIVFVCLATPAFMLASSHTDAAPFGAGAWGGAPHRQAFHHTITDLLKYENMLEADIGVQTSVGAGVVIFAIVPLVFMSGYWKSNTAASCSSPVFQRVKMNN